MLERPCVNLRTGINYVGCLSQEVVGHLPPLAPLKLQWL